MTNNSYLCKFIKQNKDWKKILSLAPYSITIKEDGKYAIFNYNMLKNPDFTLPEVQEARGIILNLENFEVACWPFRKFGNYGESYVDKIEWNSARVQEKIDGSIIKVWWKDDKWQISSNSSMNLDNSSEYCNIFNSIFNNYNKLNKDYTYIFELVSPETQIVIAYDTIDIYHLGTRNNKTGMEINEDIGIKKPKEYKLKSLDDCLNAAAALNKNDKIEHEGFVVVDDNWNRIKIKSPLYVAAHHLRLNNILTPSRIYDIVTANEKEEYLNYFPNHANKFIEYQLELDKLKDKIEKIYYICNTEANNNPVEYILNNIPKNLRWIAWAWKSGKTKEELIQNMSKNKLLKLLYKE